MKHVFLVGFMGAGKTTYGRVLAEQLNRPFIDLDEYIEKKTKRSINDIFSIDGEQVFREIETKFLKQLIDQSKEASVVSTGGGTPCFNNNMEAMKRAGKVIYLQASAQKIKENLEKSFKMGQIRPLISAKNDEISLRKIFFLLNQRVHYYEQSHVICGIEGLQTSDLLTITTELLTK